MILAGRRQGDAVAYTHHRNARRALDYELRQGPRPTDVFLYETPKQRGSYEAGECPDPGSCTAAYARIWLVSAGRGDDLFAGMEAQKAHVLKEKFRIIRRTELANVELFLLERFS